ncbi:MAG: acyl-CoA dehydrogenase family protein [Chloroflexota bacterium]
MNFELTAEEQRIQTVAREFAEQEVAPISREADERGEFPAHLVPRMAELGLFAVPSTASAEDAMPNQRSHVGYALVCEELGRVDSSVRGFLTVHVGLVAGCIAEWGTEEQQAAYSPKLTSGEWIGCYALTEPNAGSDVAGMEATARREGSEFVLNGEKIWITNGTSARVAIVFASVDRSLRHKGICAFLVDTASQGLHREPMPGKELGHRASEHVRIRLEECRVGEDALLGAEGEGFKVAMSALDRGRLGVAAGALGVAQACLEACVAYTKERRQFGQRIADFEMVQSVLADMAADVEAARLLVYKAAWLKDQGLPATKATSIAKLFATEAAVRAASEAVLLHGNRGYSNEFPVERYYRDIKGLQIYEGTSHIQRIIIARELVGRDRSG